jgi:propionyl-CoA synthetase
VPYKHLVDEALRLAQAPPRHVLIVNRGLDREMPLVPGRDLDYATLRNEHLGAEVPVTWLESNEPSYILYTSGTTGKPKGVQRDTGGYAVALTASMQHIYCGRPGETYFATSDIGWVVGHSYIVYGPLLQGMATVVYEGTPIRPDAGIWWKIVQDYKVSVMFSAPTAIRVLKKHDPAWFSKYDLSSLRHLFLAGEPLDESTARWIADALGKPVYDHYWQTETGWAILTAMPGIEPAPVKFGSPSFPAYGYDLKRRQRRGSRRERERRGRADAAPAAGLPHDRLGPGRSLRQDLLHALRRPVLLFDFRLGHPRRRRLLLHPRPDR